MTEKKKKGYLRGVRSEYKKVQWPTPKQVVQYSIVVIIMALIVACICWGLDLAFGWLVSLLVH